MTKIDKAREALTDCIEALKIQKSNVEMQLSTQWEGVADAIGLRIEKAEIALAYIESDEHEENARGIARIIFGIGFNELSKDLSKRIGIQTALDKSGLIIQQYAESYHELEREKSDRNAKIAVLEEAREMFNALDEMRPIDYSDSFNVINTLIESINKAK